MANLNYDSAGSGSYTTLATALAAVASNTDIILAKSTSNELLGASTIYTASATYALPETAQRLYSVDDFTTPDLTFGAKLTMNGSYLVSLVGNWEIYGFEFYYDASNSATPGLQLGTNAVSGTIKLDKCKINIKTTSTSNIATLKLGPLAGSTANDTYRNEINNCEIRFNAANHYIGIGVGNHFVTNLALSSDTTVPNTLFRSAGGTGLSNLYLENSDLSDIAIGGIFEANGAGQAKIFMNRCKLHSSTTFLSGTMAQHNEFTAVDCAVGDTSIQFAYYNYSGSVFSDSTVYLNGGIQENGTPLSRNLTAGAAGRSAQVTTEMLLPVADNASIQPWVKISSNVALTDVDCWIEVDAITTDATTLGTHYTTHPGVWSSGTALTNDSTSTWTNGSTYNYIIQLPSAVTSRQAHDVAIVIKLAKNGVVYVGDYGA